MSHQIRKQDNRGGDGSISGERPLAQVPKRASLRKWCWSQDLQEGKELSMERTGWNGVGMIWAGETASAKVLA